MTHVQYSAIGPYGFAMILMHLFMIIYKISTISLDILPQMSYNCYSELIMKAGIKEMSPSILSQGHSGCVDRGAQAENLKHNWENDMAAKRYVDHTGKQLQLLEKILKQSANGTTPVETRRASGEIVICPDTGVKYRVVG